MKLYAFSFNGTMLYATGNLSEEQIQEVNTYLNSFAETERHIAKKDLFNIILQNMKKDINIELNIIPIKHVFRYDKL